MLKYKFQVLDPIGLHARPATKLVGVASRFDSKIELFYGEKKANVKSVMNLMALGVKTGAEVELVVDGEDEAVALDALKAVIAENKLA
ncbi:phosphocarrier protein HPr [Mycoplasmoides fastidiosum]|uniref:Phosphocarrier protein HPr n=1 Tax=Mycoplasmoides fastidiosum TaxID=92758 RepID=A0ABU0LYD6_9BACT|nr:HPr family phosphocarrier protein [Mycoplasmoides fastidiosum]MDQ0513731.1 phosphocarrier protein HPr [Mycoplasmoides fastidiosum]UUD37847.1 HPr family phosphocarrier protein [Mycoplasmoides fastidiosum]